MAFPPDLIVRSQRVVTSDGIRPAAIHIRGEKIAGVLEFSNVLAGCPLDDAGQAAVIPGVVDTHDRPGLEKALCECYAIIRERFDRLPH